MKNRLPPAPGEWIDRERLLTFRFEGETFHGYAGDTISSALWANGVRLLGRSFKYHRPRGIFTLDDADVNALFSLAGRTNVRGDVTLLQPDMDVRGLNTIGGLKRDRARAAECLGRFMPVGFYYKAFHRPKRLFPLWERFFRQMAGLGRIDPRAASQCTPKSHAFCDVLVVGGGAAGAAAARVAADQGLDVLLVEAWPRLGGTPQACDTDRSQAAALAAQTVQHPRIEVRTGTQVTAAYADRWMIAVDGAAVTKLRARAVVLATGAIEQPAVFHNNDLPGIMMGSAAERLVHRYRVAPFTRSVVLAANSEAYQTALSLSQAGCEIAALADLRSEGEVSPLHAAVVGAGIPVHRGFGVLAAVKNAARDGMRAAVLCPVAGPGRLDVNNPLTVACDGIAVSVGWSPADSLLRQAGGQLRYDPDLAQFVPEALPEGYFVAGRANGVYGFDGQIRDGVRAGSAAAAWLHGAPATDVALNSFRDPTAHSHPYPVFTHARGKNFVDFDEDLHLKDFENAVAEGFDSPELVKRFTTVGMGPSQGKHSNMTSARILDHLGVSSLRETPLTTARPFVSPVALKHIAGRRLFPLKRTPMHAWHVEHGAVFEHAGGFLRPSRYARNGMSAEQAVAEETAAVHAFAGMVDVGTLGKFLIYGPDAVTFVERIYTGRFARLAAGMTRYGLACDEGGIVTGDGIVARVDASTFYMTTTTTGADSSYREWQRRMLIWGLDVTLINLSAAVTAMNLAGPKAAAILHRVTPLDLSPEAFPFLAYREAKIAGVQARLLRAGFVGECSYEIHVPAGFGMHVWRALMAAGEEDGIRPFGLEAQRLLRLEKGHVVIGQDTDAMSHPYELGMDWAVKMDKEYFIGQRSLRILPRLSRQRRLTGFELVQAEPVGVPAEGDLILDGEEEPGRVTSFGYSHHLKRHIGLAMVPAPHAAPGETFEITLESGKRCTARNVPLPFFDPAGDRQRAFNTPPPGGRCSGEAPLRGTSIAHSLTALEAAPGREAGEMMQHAQRDLAISHWCDAQFLGIRLSAGPVQAMELPIALPETLFDAAAFEVQEAGVVASGVEPSGSSILAVRTGARDALLILRGEAGALAEKILSQYGSPRPDGHAYLREDAGFVLSGARAKQILLQVCSYQFLLPEPKIVMTQCAAVSANILHLKEAGAPYFLILCGNNVSQHMWDVLSGIVIEEGGMIVAPERSNA